MSDRQGQDKQSSPTTKPTKHDGLGVRKAAPITKKISNVTNKLVSPVRALAKSPPHRRYLPQAAPSSSSLGGGSSSAVEDLQDPKARTASSSSLVLPPPPPDKILPKMQVFLKDKQIRGVSIADYCRATWLEGDADVQPFFAPWLESCGKFNVTVGGWEKESPSSSSFANPWDGEVYGRMRTVTFTTMRSGIGPSTADATQIHRLRVEGKDRCVISITVNMNVPFGDSFEVQVRWVVSRVGVVDELSLSAGMLVVFNKSCFVEHKIRTNTTKETIKGQANLFEAQKRICRSLSNVKGVGAQDDEDDEEDDETETIDANRAGSMQVRVTSAFQTIWSMFLLLSGWRLLSYLVNGFVALLGRPAVAIGDKDSGRENIIQEIYSAKEKLVELERLLEGDCAITPKQTESIAAVVRITNDALLKLIEKVKSN